jgi:hypothetical protein
MSRADPLFISLYLAGGPRPNSSITLIPSMKPGDTLNKDKSSSNNLNKEKRGKSLR